MAVKLLVDSASDISMQEAKELGISMIPMSIGFGDEEYYDGVDLLPKQFYEKLTTTKVSPKTAQVTPFRFEEVFEQLTSDGSEVVAVVLSSKLSGTYEGAKLASEKFDGKVFVVDSLSATVGERLLVMYALQLINQGHSAKEVFEALEEKKKKLNVMGVLETLEYLKRGGRISGAVAFIGGLLNIKPVVQVVEGEVKMAGKARGQKKGCELLNNIVQESGGIDFSMPYGVLWTGLDEGVATAYIENSQDIFGSQVPNSYIVGSTIGTHLGPGVFGVAYFAK